MSDDAAALGIPTDASVWRAQGKLPEGWSMDEIGVQLRNPPPRPWDWPYGILRSKSGALGIVVQLWRRTFTRPGFAYSVLWHPERGQSYRVESRDPDFAQLVKEAQRVIRRETRGRRRHRPPPAQYMADRDRIWRASGVEPSRLRMAEHYGVKPDTVRRWLLRPEWVRVMQDK
jgi:hypothetical protein